MLRTLTVVAAVTTAALINACSGSDSLNPAPNTNQQGGGSAHGSDTAIVTGPSKPPTPPPPVVSSFALSGFIYGHEAGIDTTRVVAVPNATVTLVKIAGVNGDTLVPPVTTASTTTDAQGAYRLENLAAAYYVIDVTAPSGSTYQNGRWGMSPARDAEVKVNISLARKP